MPNYFHVTNRQDRHRAIELLEVVRSGRMGVGDFDNQWLHKSSDDAVREISNELCWILLDDLHWKYRLIGKRTLTSRGEALFDRYAAFLRTDAPYEWRRSPWEWTQPAAAMALICLQTIPASGAVLGC